MKKGFEKRFNKGDIVYWCHRNIYKGYTVQCGMVDEQFSDAVIIDFLVPRERRLIDGIPIDDFKNEERYRKLPKGWTYNTKLFELTEEVLDKEENNFLKNCKISDSKLIKDAYNKGYLVKKDKIYGGRIESEVTNKGFRIVKTYVMCEPHITHTSISPNKLYFSYEEAKKEVDDKTAEFYRQSELSDYDWCVEQIDKNLKKYKFLNSLSDDEVKLYRDWILNQKNVEDIETRIYMKYFQWRYLDKKRWNNIEL